MDYYDAIFMIFLAPLVISGIATIAGKHNFFPYYQLQFADNANQDILKIICGMPAQFTNISTTLRMLNFNVIVILTSVFV